MPPTEYVPLIILVTAATGGAGYAIKIDSHPVLALCVAFAVVSLATIKLVWLYSKN